MLLGLHTENYFTQYLILYEIQTKPNQTKQTLPLTAGKYLHTST